MQVQSTVHRHGGMRWRPLSVADVMTNLTEGESARRPAAADRPLLRLAKGRNLNLVHNPTYDVEWTNGIYYSFDS